MTSRAEEVAPTAQGAGAPGCSEARAPESGHGRGWAVDALLSVALTAWYYRHALGRLRDHLQDVFDEKAMVYLMEWLHRSFFGAGRIATAFDLNILYPNRNVLAWSETMLGFLPPYALFRAFTPNPILAMNLMALLAVAASALGMARLGRELTGRVAVIAPAVGAVGMLAASQEGHFQLKGLALLVWAIYLLVRLVRRPGRSTVPLLVAVSAWLFLCSIYFAIMLVVVVVSALVVAAAVGRGALVAWARATLREVPILPTAIVLAVSLVPVGWVARHYLAAKAQFGGGFSVDAFVVYSARLGSLLDAPATSVLYRTAYFDWGSHEARLCFGLVTLLAVVAAALPASPPAAGKDRAVLLLLAFGALLATALAFGPFQRELLARGVRLPLPAWLYARLFPGFAVLRTIGRFGIVAAVFVGALAELGARRLGERVATRRARQVVCYGVLSAAVVLEQSTRLAPYRVELVPRRAVYEAVRDQTPPDAVLLELPVTRGGHLENVSWWHEQMLGTTVHWRRIPVGFTSLESPVLGALVHAWEAVRAGSAPPSRLVAEARALGVTHFLLDVDLVPPGLVEPLRSALSSAGLVEHPAGPRALLFGPPAAARGR